jgi:MarR family transcriptional regulator, transcriptional regulator for hemolysin
VPGRPDDRHPPAGSRPQDFSVHVDTTNVATLPGRHATRYRPLVTGAHEPSERAHAALEAVAFGSVAVTARAISATDLDLTFVQWRVLVIVGQQPDGATVSEIAGRLGAEISPLSRLVGRLVRRGLVTTRKDDRDRRVTRVNLTQAGRVIRETVLRRRRELLAIVLVGVGPIGPDVVSVLEQIGAGLSSFT